MRDATPPPDTHTHTPPSLPPRSATHQCPRIFCCQMPDVVRWTQTLGCLAARDPPPSACRSTPQKGHKNKPRTVNVLSKAKKGRGTAMQRRRGKAARAVRHGREIARNRRKAASARGHTERANPSLSLNCKSLGIVKYSTSEKSGYAHLSTRKHTTDLMHPWPL